MSLAFVENHLILIYEYLIESVNFSGKNFKLVKSRCSEDSKLVRQVYKVQ